MTSPPHAPNETSPKPLLRRVLFPALALLLSLSFAAGALELVIRLRTKVDDDGNATFMGGRIRPFYSPVEWTRRHVAMLASGKDPCFRYDPDLGWSTNPGTRCHKGQYIYDTAGVRALSVRRKLAPRAAPGVLRIGLFGDSFTHGDDVNLDATWGHVLEQELKAQGVAAEVLNLGVSGYGIDQAFLRWRKHGKPLGLDMVVLGFQSENMLRNHNMIRVLYFWRTQLPFTKPRFVIQPDGELTVLNQPAVSPEELPALLADLEHWEAKEHDDFYVAAHYEPRWWHGSRLLGFLAGWNDHHVGRLWDVEQRRYYQVDGAPAALTAKILERFKGEVESSGASFHVLHLPKRIDLEHLAEDSRSLWYADLREVLAGRHPWVETEAALLAGVEQSSVDAMYNGSDHYSVDGNRAVGRALAQALLATRQ